MLLLHPSQPYRFDLLLKFLSRWRFPVLDIASGDTYRRTLRAANGLALIEVRQESSSGGERLIVRVLNEHRNDTVELVHLAGWVLNIDMASDGFWPWARANKDLWDALAPVEGLPLPRTESLYDALICTITEQQIAWTAAQRAQRLLCEWGGEGVAYDGEIYYAIPSPKRLAAADLSALKPLKITDRRVTVLINIAADVASGRLDLERLRDLTPAERYAGLVSIKGVGHWTAVMALARAYGTHPATASNDVALRSAVKLYLPQHAAAADPITAAFANCGEFAGPAAMYLLSRYVIDRY